MSKLCIKCNISKELDEFAIRKDSPDGRRNTCKECRRIYISNWKNNPPVKEVFPDGYKRCTKCKIIKETCNFGKSKTNKNGLKSWCWECKRKDSEKWNKAHTPYFKQYSNEHRAELKIKKKKYAIENKEMLKETARKYRLKHSDKIKEKHDIYYNANKESILARKKEYYQLNKDKIIKREMEYVRRSKQATMRKCLRGRFRSAIKNKKKTASVLKLLGCTIDFFVTYIEERFQEGMSWSNYGFYGWHIDHIIPLSSFDLGDESQAAKAFNYTNLQPLWAADNLKKGAKMPQIKE